MRRDDIEQQRMIQMHNQQQKNLQRERRQKKNKRKLPEKILTESIIKWERDDSKLPYNENNCIKCNQLFNSFLAFDSIQDINLGNFL